MRLQCGMPHTFPKRDVSRKKPRGVLKSIIIDQKDIKIGRKRASVNSITSLDTPWTSFRNRIPAHRHNEKQSDIKIGRKRAAVNSISLLDTP